MANSRFAYVRDYELPDPLLQGTFIILRIDGHAFKKFTEAHGFSKPNDNRGLALMDHAAVSLMGEYPDIVLGFGQSDEYSFLLRKSAVLYNRRRSKITSLLCSHFTSAYVMKWYTFFPDTPLSYPPSFDARIILYPGVKEVRDYFSWRQADTHINNLHNTVFWSLVQKADQSPKQANDALRNTGSSQKHEILFQRFGINYNALPSRSRKGSVLVKEQVETEDMGELSPVQKLPFESLSSDHALAGSKSDLAQPRQNGKRRTKRESSRIALLHCDIITDEFWNCRPYLLPE